jgi:hypothetical protein
MTEQMGKKLNLFLVAHSLFSNYTSEMSNLIRKKRAASQSTQLSIIVTVQL